MLILDTDKKSLPMNYMQTPGLEEFPISDAKTEFYHQQSQKGNDI